MAKVRNIDTLQLDGGALCFHFINTVYAWRGINLHEYLNTYEEVMKWCKKVDILTISQRANLLKTAKLQPETAAKALQELKENREMLYHFFSAVAAPEIEQLPPIILRQFNTALSFSFSHLDFKVKKKQVQLEWNNAKNDLLQPLWLVIKSAYDILTAGDRSRIKECPKCGWIFMDNTKNNKRRWCNPSFCGSTEKSKKYYKKIRKAKMPHPAKEPD